MTEPKYHEAVLDSETRFDCNGELKLLSVAIVDRHNVQLYMPVRPPGLSLEEIERINNLPFPPEVHALASPPSVVRNVVKEMLRGSTVIVWNEEHEKKIFPFLSEVDQRGRSIFRVQDAMVRASPYVKGWNPYFSAYEYPSLSACAAHLGFEFSDPGWHDARADAQMTLKIWGHMENHPPFPVASSVIAPKSALPGSTVIDDECPFTVIDDGWSF